MAVVNLSLSFLTDVDGNAMSINSKIAESIAMIEKAGDYLLINNEFACYNESELRSLLTERGIL